MHAIIVPTINSNDTDALLVEWQRNDGDVVRPGETLAILQTTKATFELEAEAAGLLHTSAAPLQRHDFGSTLGWIFADAAERDQYLRSREPAKPEPAHDLVITAAAKTLIATHGIDEARLRSIGRKVIKAADIEALLGTAPAEIGAKLDSRQQTIARVVTRSHRAVPDSYLVKKIDVDTALAALGDFGKEKKLFTGLPDLLVWTVARLRPAHPLLFGALRDDLSFTASSQGNVGVTFDTGQGLFIPVLRGVPKLTLAEVARQLMAFRMRAMRNTFHEKDFAGGDLTISINAQPDTIFVIPIILAPQTCMLGLGAVQTELRLAAEGAVVPRRFVYLGVAFDHRAANGSQADAFATEIKATLEQPDPARWDKAEG